MPKISQYDPQTSLLATDELLIERAGVYYRVPSAVLGTTPVGIVTDATTARTLSASDIGKLISFSSASDITLTLPQDADAAIPVGSSGYYAKTTVSLAALTPVAGTGATKYGGFDGTLSIGQGIGKWTKVAANTYAVESSGAAYAEVLAHIATADPHAGYQLETLPVANYAGTTNRNMVAADVGRISTFSANVSVTATLLSDTALSTVAVGATGIYALTGTGPLSVIAGAGVTVVGHGTLAVQNSMVRWTKVAANTYFLEAVNNGAAETIAGVKTFSSDPIVPDEAYGVGWDGTLEVPTKNAVYDKIESLPELTADDPSEVDLATAGGVTTLALLDTVARMPYHLRLGTTFTCTQSNTVLQNVTGLVTASIPANTVWELHLFLITEASTTADMKMGFVCSGATLDWSSQSLSTGTANHIGSINQRHRSIGESETFGGAGAANEVVMNVFGRLALGGSAATLQVQAAQNASEASDCKVLAGSYITLTRVA